MEMSSSHSTPKLRPQRLRASCDGCFLAKVKCSKTRPICTRCLTCGTDCKYSPSSRAGKPRADAIRARQSSSNASVASSVASEDGGAPRLQFTVQPTSAAMDVTTSPLTYTLDANWSTPSGSSEEEHSRPSISANATPMISEGSLDSDEMAQVANELFNSNFDWNTSTPHPQLPTPFQSDQQSLPFPLPPRSKSLAEIPISHSLTPWFEDSHDLVSIPPHQNFSGPSPFIAPYAQTASPPFETQSKPPPVSINCNCFTTCLQSLQALHNASSVPSSTSAPLQTSPPFDLVLTVNRKAVSSCASLLSCRKCLSRAGSMTTTMLLATIIGKIMSFYRAAAKSHFVSNFAFNASGDRGDVAASGTGVAVGNGGLCAPIALGRYFVTGEDGRWLEMEIMWRELRKLEGLCGRFGEVCARGDGEEEGVEGAVLSYLGRSLQVTFEVLGMHEGYGVVGVGDG